mmetsp:Transcript_32022/g.28380  ORF Transcript_32022/g.28380 Transcript_32022/m.28380 type:complete len:181 (+) Transcript_32022:299-841(+)
MVEQIIVFCSLFWLVYLKFKENYSLSNSLTEIFIDFNRDPVILYDDEGIMKCNNMFNLEFGTLIKSEKIRHHSQMLTTILNSNEIIFEFYQGSEEKQISLLEVIKNRKEMDQKELILKHKGGDKIFMFSFNKLENIYHSKTLCVFKDNTHIHELNKVQGQVEFRSVIMGCLTHELRTPVN